MRRSPADAATRRAYDTVARDYARMLPDMSVEAPLDRACLSAFVELLTASPDTLVAELGCGSGRVAAHLTDLGARMVGFDLSPEMTASASSARPDIPFAAADMAALPLQPAVLAGIVAWYSVIHLPPAALPEVFREFARTMLPGAPVLIAFQSGDGDRVDRTTSYGHPVPLTYYRHATEEMTGALAEAGFRLHATLRREPALAHETTAQSFVLARRPEAA